MATTQKTAIVTGGSQGIGAGLVRAFLDRGYNVVANSRNITKSGAFEASDKLALVDGSIAEAATAAKIAEVAKNKFGSIDALVNNAGIFFTKPFTDYTAEDFKSLVSTNVEGFLYVTQLSIMTIDATTGRDRLAKLSIHLAQALTPLGACVPGARTASLNGMPPHSGYA
jgi:NAD(P)-dependent dehydrogenase (short-subunit alcohol dehydrogenase family)